MNFRDQLQYRYNMAGVVEKLIAINVIVFVFVFLLKAVAYLFQFGDFFTEWLVFPKEIGEYIYKPWTIITYAFMHNGIWHILSNMLILYFAGRMFLTFFSPKRLLSYYFLGAISGALLFMVSYNIFPAFAGTGNSYLLGASAAVMAVLLGVTTQAPHMRVRLMIIGSIKLWWIAAFFVISDIVQMPFNNPGGHLAHIGGALLGYTYTTQLQKGTDIGGWFEKFMDSIAILFSKKEKSPFKKVYKNKSRTKRAANTKSSKSQAVNHQQKIDGILDKISKSGYESLNKAEKDFLFNSGKD
ncbi:rhomboid family intramembrane serine protease [Mesonia aestuariivivens]|uniref:Rhomboid family intramembrane serine protease n=1 Tax=Mesonia aestuariivivens TaxID=2796128 RepID=A0ABS6VZX0_9FLAO|nr:rhomboid family intramembrane serine protease [Mesonia aestuariivivens]MBW2961150.1 rhomboid family intramembrane serine protease [Mesonia aestuariivivens]